MKSFTPVRLLAAVAAASLLVASPNARAQGSAQPASGEEGASAEAKESKAGAAPGAGAEEQSPKHREARQRFERGIQLFEEGNAEAAQIEFQRAYELHPSWKILYNIAVCYRAKSDYVAALDTFTQYLEEGGAEVPAERRASVEKAIETLKPRIGRIAVQSSVKGAAVAVDDVRQGVTPLKEAVRVNPGRRRVSLTKAGYIPQTESIVVAPSETKTLSFKMEKKTTIVVDRGKGIKPYLPYIAWGATGVFAVAAGTTGFFALQAKSDQDDRLNDPNTTSDQLADGRSQMRTLSIVADGLTVAAVAAGGLALYWTLNPPGKDDDAKGKERAPAPKAQRPKVNVGLGPGGFGLSGAF